MQKKYLCTFYSAFKLIIPPKMKMVIKEWITLCDNEDSSSLTVFQQKIADFS